jgi:DNA-binding SARP family transcriptional activator
MRLNLFGGFEILLGSDEHCSLQIRKAEALLAYLCLYPGRPQSREKLATLLWGDTPDEQARSSLRQAFSAIRRALPDVAGIIEAQHDWVRLRCGTVLTDVAEFEAALAIGGFDGLIRAIDLYRGDLLDGLHIRSSGFAEWIEAERQRLRTQAVGAMVELLEMEGSIGGINAGVQFALRILALDETQEVVHRALMRHYALRNRRSDALRQYFRCREILKREFGALPEAETEDLYTHILKQDQGVAARNLVNQRGDIVPQP